MTIPPEANTAAAEMAPWPVRMVQQGYGSAQERLDFLRGCWEHKCRIWLVLTEREALTAEMIALDLIAAAVEAQKAGTVTVDLSVDLASPVARTVGLFGSAKLSLHIEAVPADLLAGDQP